jgi:hypothetical protein
MHLLANLKVQDNYTLQNVLATVAKIMLKDCYGDAQLETAAGLDGLYAEAVHTSLIKEYCQQRPDKVSNQDSGNA